MTRGQRDWLDLHCGTLSFSTSHRLGRRYQWSLVKHDSDDFQSIGDVGVIPCNLDVACGVN